jgi:hypothetical protein
LLDDIVSELWRKENVTSGYCPRYRYTLIATLTLGNLYYMCVYFLPTHTIGESVLPAHFLRVIRRSFRGSILFMWIVRSFFMWIVRSGRPRRAGHSLGHSFVRSFVILSLGHSLGHFWESFVGSFFRWFRVSCHSLGVVSFLDYFVGCGRLCPFVREFSCVVFVLSPNDSYCFTIEK